jgi:uncharacterized membrane protein YfcA
MDERAATPRRRASWISILCAGLLTGCGGGGGGGTPAVAAPTITAQPQSRTVTTGSSATFTVAASGASLKVARAPVSRWVVAALIAGVLAACLPVLFYLAYGNCPNGVC